MIANEGLPLSWSKIPYRRYSCGLTRRGKGPSKQGRWFRRAASLPAPGRTTEPDARANRCAAVRLQRMLPGRTRPVLGFLFVRALGPGQPLARLAGGGRSIRTIGPCREGAGLYCGGELGDRRGSQENSAGYRWFESISLQRRVSCELFPRGAIAGIPPSTASRSDSPGRDPYQSAHKPVI
jgi:hypothetical protein